VPVTNVPYTVGGNGTVTTTQPIAVANCSKPEGNQTVDLVTGQRLPWNKTDYMNACAMAYCGGDKSIYKVMPASGYAECSTCFDEWAGDDSEDPWYEGVGSERGNCRAPPTIPAGTTPDGYYQWDAAGSQYVQVVRTGDDKSAGQYRIVGDRVESKDDGTDTYKAITRLAVFTRQQAESPVQQFGQFLGSPVVAYPVKGCASDSTTVSELEEGNAQELRSAASNKVAKDRALDSMVDGILDHIVA